MKVAIIFKRSFRGKIEAAEVIKTMIKIRLITIKNRLTTLIHKMLCSGLSKLSEYINNKNVKINHNMPNT